MTKHDHEGSGILRLADGYRFYWNRSGDGEVWGSLESPDYNMVKGTSGWYRTQDPEAAAAVAMNLVATP